MIDILIFDFHYLHVPFAMGTKTWGERVEDISSMLRLLYSGILLVLLQYGDWNTCLMEFTLLSLLLNDVAYDIIRMIVNDKMYTCIEV